MLPAQHKHPRPADAVPQLILARSTAPMIIGALRLPFSLSTGLEVRAERRCECALAPIGEAVVEMPQARWLVKD